MASPPLPSSCTTTQHPTKKKSISPYLFSARWVVKATPQAYRRKKNERFITSDHFHTMVNLLASPPPFGWGWRVESNGKKIEGAIFFWPSATASNNNCCCLCVCFEWANFWGVVASTPSVGYFIADRKLIEKWVLILLNLILIECIG